MTSDPLQLERHTAFATRLARGLVADQNAADDLVQETWLAVLRRPPRDPDGIRGYVATTLRRLAGRARRGEARRSERERDVARPEALPSSAALTVAMEQHQRVVAALLELNEVTRAALLLRYFENLPPREIARRSGEPVETVRTRLKRGLAALRTRLDEREGGRSVWAVTLAPLCRTTPSLGPLAGALVMTTQSKLVIAAALVLVGGLAWRVAGERPERALPVEAGGALPEELALAEAPADDSARLVGEAATSRTALVAGVPRDEASVPSTSRLLVGSIRVVDTEGREHALEDGGFVAVTDEQVQVIVQAGYFEFPRPETDSVRIHLLHLGGRTAFLDSNEVALPDDGRLKLVATWPPTAILRVVDARTREDLDGLTVLRGVGRSRDAVHPGAFDERGLFASDASSPLEVSTWNETESWWVHAPGYAWGWLRFDHRAGGERELALEPGASGDLVIRLENFSPDLNLWVHVFPPDWERSHSSLAEVHHPTEAELVFKGLPAGQVQVRAELGIWHDGPRELARTVIDLLPGVQTEVVLDLEQQGVLPAAVPLAGRIVFPASQPDLELAFRIMPAEGAGLRKGDNVYSGQLTLERNPDQPRVRRFDAGLVTPGHYLFVSPSLQYWEAFDVGPRGAPDVELALPEVGEVRVRVVDEESSAPLAIERIDWSAGQPEGLTSWTLASARPDPETGEYRFFAPLRRISVSTNLDEYADLQRSIDVVAGVQELELRVRRVPGAWIRLVDGDANVPIEWSWNVSVEPINGTEDENARVTRIENGRAFVVVSEPGTYLIELPLLEGFAPVPPQTLELGPSGPEELVIPLRRL